MGKIVIITPIFPPEQRGPATYCFELCQKIPSVVITFTKDPTPIKNIKIISVPTTGISFLRQLRLLSKIIKESNDCNLIYAQGADVCGFAAVIAGKLLHKPVVIKFVGDLVVEMERDFNKKVPYLFFVTKLTLNLADKIIFPARHLQDSICEKYKIDKNKTNVIYNAV